MSATAALSPAKALTMAMTLCAPLLLAAALPARGADGETLYKIYCTQCHGVEGYGNGVNVPAMSVQPRNHRDRGEMSARTDEELFKAIKHGGKSINKSVLMPTWGQNLNDDEINALVLYLRELCCNSGG
ncbi:MAG: cytochrome c [Porticoccaceae bacterium]|jgi:mono/diheme cytochrome c family protein